MQTFTPDDLEEDILADLMEEINELYESSEQTLIELELRPEDNELQRALFRSIHTIKGDLGLVNFSPMIPLLQHVEDLLDYLRKGQVAYTSTMSDLVLLTMDRVKAFVEAVMASGKAEYDDNLHNQLVLAIGRVTPENTAEHEKRLTVPLLVSSSVLFYLGILFAYFVVFPLIFAFFTSTAPEGVLVMTDISAYLSFVLKLFFAFGVAFEVPVVTVLLVKTGMTTTQSLKKKRPYIIVGAFVVGMMMTPPDIFSQTMLALPVWLLFEIGLFFGKRMEPKASTVDETDDELEDELD